MHNEITEIRYGDSYQQPRATQPSIHWGPCHFCYFAGKLDADNENSDAILWHTGMELSVQCSPCYVIPQCPRHGAPTSLTKIDNEPPQALAAFKGFVVEEEWYRPTLFEKACFWKPYSFKKLFSRGHILFFKPVWRVPILFKSLLAGFLYFLRAFVKESFPY